MRWMMTDDVSKLLPPPLPLPLLVSEWDIPDTGGERLEDSILVTEDQNQE